MKVETLLPLGKVDPGLRQSDMPLNIHTVGTDAQLVEQLGYDGLVVEETKDDPFLIMALAAQTTTRIHLGTSVALAFPRSPTVTAMTAWSLQKLTKGRFILGLGTQVKGHIERRFGVKWTAPGPRMREYVQALKAVWDCWQNGTKLDFHGEHYQLSLMVPLLNPGPIEHPRIPIHLAAVNRYMCQVAGEVADGIRPHPVCTRKYLQEVMLPAIRKGAAKAGRKAAEVAVCMKPLVATAPDEEKLQVKIRDIRARVAFYASTPGYRPVFDTHGLGALAADLSVLSKQQRWEEMPPLISDDILNMFAVVGTYDQIVQRLREKYENIATHVEFSIPVQTEKDREQLQKLVTDLRAL
jgi:probable F420-dependent oxidoreductase